MGRRETIGKEMEGRKGKGRGGGKEGREREEERHYIKSRVLNFITFAAVAVLKTP